MKSNFLRIIFDIIILIVLAVLIFYIIMVFIGIAMGDEARYVGYLNSIADSINNKNHGRVFISNYDYNYVFVLTNKDGWYLQLYRCSPPNYVVGALSVKIAYWNVSTVDSGNTIIFAPALEYCKLIKQRSLNVDEINIKIQGLNVDAGLLAYSSNKNSLGQFQIFIGIMNYFFPISSMFLTIVNDTTITCNNNGCTFASPNVGGGNVYCAPNPNIDYKSQNLPYNPSKCVELSGFPRNPQVSFSNLVGEIINAATFGNIFEKIFGIDFPILYFAGSLPPTAIYIDT
ncbi:MAG: hypothetical protein ACO2OX_00720, partial [Candidatus Nanopusillus sp.]